ncbi:LysR family transcriptional regulator [Paenibacillus sp. JX-17]|uniref:LysR family transcriptional regulator n=1 Tax=Paenibacillus lacisoli TaxID=3064525 RepID=A0ABT9CGJ8_9BACL|nr:LysR family transcriptional regulator [Paenibacillus sp. JX-17]MDO7908020.1 LysR family transcriptional regulator [Paenibacillus sp. JX-17]
MLNQLDGKYIYTFLKVYELRNISKASLLLGFSQSTITNHIQILEQVIGAKLFDRTIHGVRPTEKGETFAEYAYQFYSLSKKLNDEIHDFRGTVKVKALESFCVTHFSSPIIQFIEQYPTIEIELTTGFHQNVIDDVLNQRVDLGIIPFDPQSSKLEYTPILEEEFVFVHSSRITQEKLMQAEVRVIGFGNNCIYQTVANEMLVDYGKIDYRNIAYASLEMIKQTVISGAGIALVPRCSVEHELQTEQLHIFDLGKPVLIHHGIIGRQSAQPKESTEMFKQFLLRSFNTITT